MTKEGYLRQQKVLQNRLMKKHLVPVYAALQYQVKETVDIVNSQGIDAALQKTYRDHYINPKIGASVSALYADAGRQASNQFRLQKSLVIPLVGFVRDVISYFNAFLLEKVVLPISQSMVHQIQAILKQAISDGWGVEKTVRELKTSEITKMRAKMIVRTESVRAMNYAQLKAADNEKYMVEKTWLATEDRRTRFTHGHAGVDGEQRDLYDAFSNGLQFPGDPSGSAAEVINCRCTMTYRIKRDLQGNPVRKVPLRAAELA
jgi:Phage Mu protein F like protein